MKVPRCQHAGKQTQEQGPAFLSSLPSDLEVQTQPSPLFLGVFILPLQTQDSSLLKPRLLWPTLLSDHLFGSPGS